MTTRTQEKMSGPIATTTANNSNEDLNESIQSSTHIGYYFPYRYTRNKTSEGAWLRSYKEEQNRRFKAILCNNYKTLEEVKSQVHGPKQTQQSRADDQIVDEEQERKLNGFFLLKHCYAEDPTEVFSFNINGHGFSYACSEDFILFDHVQCISASENKLKLEAFVTFSHLQELELPLNGLTNLEVKYGDFAYLQHLDLSYNNLPGNCLKKLGVMPNLVTLNLSGNNITEIPTDFAKCFRLSDELRYMRFPRLRILKLDNNKLWHPETFVSLGTLPLLEHLDLDRNLLYHVPQLFNQDGRIILYEELPHSFLNEECSASDLNDTTQNLSAEENEESPIKESKTDTDEVINTLLSDLSDLSGDSMDLLEDDIPTDIFSQTQPLTEREHISEKSIVPVQTSIETQDSQQTHNYKTRPVVFRDKTRPPFSRLLYLKLANNRFSNEEGLLAIAAWPTIRVISIHGNPLVKNFQMRKMNLLRRIFAQKLGISIISQCPSVPSHHHTEIYPRVLRTVKDDVRKLPKLTVDQILALESFKADPPSSAKRSTSANSEQSSHSTYKGPASTCTGGYYESKEMSDSDEAEENSTQGNAQDMSQTTDSAFFMTQSCDEPVPKTSEPPLPKPKKYSTATELLRQRFKEYEILFEEDEDEDKKHVRAVQPSKDIHSNVKALRYALDHQCTVWDKPSNIRSIKVRSPSPPKHLLPAKMPALTYEERVANCLEDVKQNTAVKEMTLLEVFNNPDAHKEELKEAKKLLREVESCYHVKSGELVYQKDEG